MTISIYGDESAPEVEIRGEGGGFSSLTDAPSGLIQWIDGLISGLNNAKEALQQGWGPG